MLTYLICLSFIRWIYALACISGMILSLSIPIIDHSIKKWNKRRYRKVAQYLTDFIEDGCVMFIVNDDNDSDD